MPWGIRCDLPAESPNNVPVQIVQGQEPSIRVVRKKIIGPDITSNTIRVYGRNQIRPLTNLISQHNGAVGFTARINRIFTICGEGLAQLVIEPEVTRICRLRILTTTTSNCYITNSATCLCIASGSS